MEKAKIDEILRLHRMWLVGDENGRRADLTGADQRDADLTGADLTGADLRDADLTGADLRDADLRRADLKRADLTGADLTGADLRDADLTGADLRHADLRDADLTGTDLTRAVLRGADLTDAKINLCQVPQTIIVPDGTIIGWKKIHSESGNVIVKLSIPAASHRSNATGRKCRCEYADVLEIIGADSGYSDYDKNFIYSAGNRVTADSFDENRWNECSNGIHFFITKQEAENYEL